MKQKNYKIIGYVEVKYQHINHKAKGVAKFAIYDRMATDTSLIVKSERLLDKYLRTLNKQGFVYEVLYHDGSEKDLFA
jgi:hypothetical protein